MKGVWKMRKVTYGAANSLDNYIARPDGGVDWLLWSKDVSAITAEFWKGIDTVLMGRKTYDVARAKGVPAYKGVKNYVFSRTLKPGRERRVEIVSEDAVEFVRRLKNEEGKGICLMGGGELASSLLEAGLVDEVGANVHPILLGSGVPLFRPLSRQIELELIECRVIAHGCVYLTYRVKR